MRTLRDVDPLVLTAILALLALGVTMVYSAGAIYAADFHGSEAFYIRRHLVFAVLGLGVMAVTAAIPYQSWRPWTYPLLLLVGLLLLLVLVPGVGVTLGGATRWLPAGPIFVQPSELAKLVLVLYLAYSLEKKQSHIGTFAIGILPHLVFSGAILVLILVEPDYGTTMTLAALLFVMMFVAGLNLGPPMVEELPHVMAEMVQLPRLGDTPPSPKALPRIVKAPEPPPVETDAVSLSREKEDEFDKV